VRKPQIKYEPVVDTISEKVIVFENRKEAAFIIIEESATFNGGDINKFRLWVQKNLVYPAASAEAGISGRVIVQFAVNSKGEVEDVIILRSINSELDNEALRAVMKSPKWIPGKKEGKAIKQQFVIPITFQLQ
jgi:protein TonB